MTKKDIELLIKFVEVIGKSAELKVSVISDSSSRNTQQ